MNQTKLKKLLTDLYKNKLSPDDAIKQLQIFPYENIEFAKIDHHRELRSGLPEVIYGQGKSAIQLKEIIQKLQKAKSNILATKISANKYKKIKTFLPQKAVYNAQGKTLVI